MKYGAVKAAIVEAHKAHPDWTARQIAEHVGCCYDQVSNAKSRYALEIPNEAPSDRGFAERRTRNAEAVRKVFKAEAALATDPRVMTAFATLAAVGDVEMLDRVMRSLRV